MKPQALLLMHYDPVFEGFFGDLYFFFHLICNDSVLQQFFFYCFNIFFSGPEETT